LGGQKEERKMKKKIISLIGALSFLLFSIYYEHKVTHEKYVEFDQIILTAKEKRKCEIDSSSDICKIYMQIRSNDPDFQNQGIEKLDNCTYVANGHFYYLNPECVGSWIY
jgi:hypothetical protein